MEQTALPTGARNAHSEDTSTLLEMLDVPSASLERLALIPVNPYVMHAPLAPSPNYWVPPLVRCVSQELSRLKCGPIENALSALRDRMPACLVSLDALSVI